MELTDNDLKAIAEVRFKTHKELNWMRKYTVPMYSSLTVGVILALFLGNFVRAVQPYVAGFTLALLVFAYVVYVNWRNHIKRPWVAKFIQNYKDTKELMP
jgi:hypothetical protein